MFQALGYLLVVLSNEWLVESVSSAGLLFLLLKLLLHYLSEFLG